MLDRLGLRLYFMPWGKIFALGGVAILFFLPLLGLLNLINTERSMARYIRAASCATAFSEGDCRYEATGTVTSRAIKRIGSRYGTSESYYLMLQFSEGRFFDVRLNRQAEWQATADGTTVTAAIWEGRVVMLHVADREIDLVDTPQDLLAQAKSFLVLSGALSSIMLVATIPALIHRRLTTMLKPPRPARPHQGKNRGEHGSKHRR